MANKGNYTHGKHGWFESKPRSYGRLLKSEAVQVLAQSYPPSSRSGNLYQLQHFLEINKVGAEEVLTLSDKEIKKYVRKACLHKISEGHYESARRMFYVIRRFLELNDKEIHFNHTEKRTLFKRKLGRLAIQHIPTKTEIYRMVDAVSNKGARQQSRARAILLCLWQSGVRASCLCSWTWGIFKKQLYPQVKTPIPIKVVAERVEGLNDCALDTKLSSYAVGYYYTFLHESSAWALRTYLDERIADGWQPKDEDPIFVTEGVVSKNQPINSKHLLEVVKNCAKQIGINRKTVWTHTLRKAFRKELYKGGLDGDIAEALMGHKLPGSRGSYFDYHDVKFVANEYLKCFWNRIDIDRVTQLEKQIGDQKREMEEEIEKRVTERIQPIKNEVKDMETLKERMAQLEKHLSLIVSGPGVLVGEKGSVYFKVKQKGRLQSENR